MHLLPYTKSVTFTEILSIQGRFFEFLFYAAKIQKILTQTTDIPNFTFRLRAGCSLPTRTFKFSVALGWFTSRADHHPTTVNRGQSPTAAQGDFGNRPTAPPSAMYNPYIYCTIQGVAAHGCVVGSMRCVGEKTKCKHYIAFALQNLTLFHLASPKLSSCSSCTFC